MSRLVLIDGSSYLYRAFHALPPLTNADGEPTGALFGVVNMLRAHAEGKARVHRLRASTRRARPSATTCIREYKANRPPMPDDLRAQVEPMMRDRAGAGLPDPARGRRRSRRRDRHAGAAGRGATASTVTISTGDKDFAQLVRPGITLVNTMTGSRLRFEAQRSSRSSACAPTRSSIYLALMGDSVDNIPGVDKCGPKTAAKWLAEYGTLDDVIANADKIGGKIGENLRAALPRLPLNRDLVTIKTDVPLERHTAATAAARTRRRGAARAVHALRLQARRCGTRRRRRQRRQLPDREPGRAAVAGFAAAGGERSCPDAALSAPGEYETDPHARAARRLGRDAAAPTNCCLRHRDRFARPDAANLVGMSFCVEAGRAAYIPLGARLSPARRRSCRSRRGPRRLARRCWPIPARPKLGQHGKYDLHVLRRHGIDVRGYADDTMLESFVLNAGIAAATTWIRWRRRYLGYHDHQVRGRGRQGRQADPVLAGRARRRHPLRRRGCRHHPAPASRAAAEAGGRARRWQRSTATSRCRWCRCWRASRPTAC